MCVCCVLCVVCVYVLCACMRNVVYIHVLIHVKVVQRQSHIFICTQGAIVNCNYILED